METPPGSKEPGGAVDKEFERQRQRCRGASADVQIDLALRDHVGQKGHDESGHQRTGSSRRSGHGQTRSVGDESGWQHSMDLLGVEVMG